MPVVWPPDTSICLKETATTETPSPPARVGRLLSSRAKVSAATVMFAVAGAVSPAALVTPPGSAMGPGGVPAGQAGGVGGGEGGAARAVPGSGDRWARPA